MIDLKKLVLITGLVGFVALAQVTAVEFPVAANSRDASARLPNVVIIFIDDLGYADIGAFGAKKYATPNLDQMARNGRRFTDFVASSAVCSASRAALLTGCLHQRIGIHGALMPNSKVGIHADEITLGELCQQKNYATACFGKWHLGLQKQFLPLQNGFDQYFGLPYSNDMWPFHPDFADLPPEQAKRKSNFPDLPLFDGNEIVVPKVTGGNQAQLTTQYTKRAVEFIDENADRPFLLYVPHSMVHVPLFVSDKFKGKSGAGLFGDVMMEVDWSVGKIIGAINRHGLEENTLIVFTSDNGPWLSYGTHAGSAAPLREGKGTMFEGGYRVPTIMQWAGRIPAGTTCDELASTIDMFPTIAALLDAKLPKHAIDGLDIRPLMFGDAGALSPHQFFPCYYGNGELQAIRNRNYKLVFPHTYRSLNGRIGHDNGSPIDYDSNQAEFALYDLKADIGETQNVAKDYPAVVEQLEAAANRCREELGDRLQQKTGSGTRPIGKFE